MPLTEVRYKRAVCHAGKCRGRLADAAFPAQERVLRRGWFGYPRFIAVHVTRAPAAAEMGSASPRMRYEKTS